jgi:hypothetical protein
MWEYRFSVVSMPNILQIIIIIIITIIITITKWLQIKVQFRRLITFYSGHVFKN